MNRGRPAALLAGLLCLLAGTHVPSRAADVRLAVIAGDGERAPEAALVAELEVALSKQEGVILVERELIRQVLAEHELTLGALSDPVAAAEAGRLLSAELFLFVEKVAQVEPAACRLRVVETGTGILLGGATEGEAVLRKRPIRVLRLVETAAAKARVPVRDRRHVGIVGFRSEEPGRSLDSLATAIGTMVQADLARSPEIVVLEREELQRLTAEEGLTGLGVDLRPSAVLLRGGLKRTPDGKQIQITVSLSDHLGKELKRVVVRTAGDNLSEARRAIARAVIDALGTVAVPAEGISQEEEAAVFARRAEVLLAHGEKEAAARAAETALALAPCMEYRALACRIWHSVSHRRTGPLRDIENRRRREGLPLDGTEVGSERKLSALKALLRKLELERDVRAEHIAAWSGGGGADLRIPFIPERTPGLWLAVGAHEPDVAQVRAQAKALLRANQETRIEYYAARYGDYAYGYWYIVAKRLLVGNNRNLHRVDDSVEEWIALAKDAVRRFLSPPGPTPAKARPTQAELIRALAGWGMTERYPTPAARAALAAFSDWLVAHDDPTIRFAGYASRVKGDPSPGHAESAREALEILRRELPVDHSLRTAEAHYGPFPGMTGYLLLALPTGREQEAACRTILDPILAARDTERLVEWRSVVRDVWLPALEEMGHPEQADALARRILDLLREGPPAPRLAAKIGRWLARELQRKRARYTGKPVERGPATSAWDDYVVERVETGPEPEGCGTIAAVLRRGKRLIVVWYGSAPENVLLKVTSASLTGRRRVSLGECSLPRVSNRTGLPLVTCAGTDGSGVYIGTCVSGLAVLNNGVATHLTEEDGLAANAVASLACHRGKVYLSCCDSLSGYPISSALVQYDPDRREFRTLASSRSLEQRHGLDGGKSHFISSLLADEKQECIWLGVSERWGPRRGLWCYSPGTGKLEHAWFPGNLAYDGIRGMVPYGDRMLVLGSLCLLALDLRSFQATSLLLKFKDRDHGYDPDNPPVFGTRETSLWPAALIGDHLLAGRGFNLYTEKGAPPTPLSRAPGKRALGVSYSHSAGNHMLHLDDRTVLLRQSEGGLWTIRRKR